jgi:hypothetical protein
MLRYRVNTADGGRKENTSPVRLLRDFPTEKAAWREVDRLGLLVRINSEESGTRIRFDALAEYYLKADFGEDAVRPKSVNTIPIAVTSVILNARRLEQLLAALSVACAAAASENATNNIAVRTVDTMFCFPMRYSLRLSAVGKHTLSRSPMPACDSITLLRGKCTPSYRCRSPRPSSGTGTGTTAPPRPFTPRSWNRAPRAPRSSSATASRGKQTRSRARFASGICARTGTPDRPPALGDIASSYQNLPENHVVFRRGTVKHY